MTDNFSRPNVCNEISEDLSAFIDGELSKEKLAEIYEHLLECENCKQSYENLKLTQKTVKNYFKTSTENFEIPEKIFEKENIISKIVFAQKRKILIYTAAVFMFIAAVTYFSINMFSVNLANQETIHKVKFIKKDKSLDIKDKKNILTPAAQDKLSK